VARTVLVTRPGEAGRELAAALVAAGQPALWLPAFEFGPPPDEALARALLADVDAFDLAIVVSPQAARATAALLARPWPAGTAIAAVGAGTEAVVRAAVAGAAQARLLAPPDAGDMTRAGSEALWPLLESLRPSRVLLLRAQGGREWLAEQLAAAGAAVTPLAVYSRRPFVPDTALRARLAEAAEAGLASVVSSSDAVGALAAMLAPQPELLRALQAAPALAAHPRIAERLRAAGFARVAVCPAQAEAIVKSLREGDR
jgi:uroporphyrinogen-III synthase